MDSPGRREAATRIARKLHRRRPGESRRSSSIMYPDRLRPGPDKDDDVASAHGLQAHMNQSMFSMIAAAGSRADFHPRFGEQSSGSDTEHEDEDEGDSDGHSERTKPAVVSGSQAQKSTLADRPGQPLSSALRIGLGAGVPDELDTTNALNQDVMHEQETDTAKSNISRRHESKLLQSLPRFHTKSNREKNYMSQSMILPSKESDSVVHKPSLITPRDAPVLRKILEAEPNDGREQSGDRSGDASPSKTASKGQRDSDQDPGPRRSLDSRPKLMAKLKEIFAFDELEEVVSEYPCWLLQSVLLQGYLYITEKHFCFYAYLPKQSNAVIKSGSLLKKVKRGPKYNRQWFILKGDILSYYDTPASTYFQVGYVDLRFATSASLSESKDSDKDTKNFTVTTPTRTYYFTADSATSAKEWVKMLQRVIFRTHNDGDSVKIALPIANVIDIEESPVIEVAKTVKIRVFERQETFAVDEYYFSFFSFGQDAITVMQSMASETPAQNVVSQSEGAVSEGSPGRGSKKTPRSPAAAGAAFIEPVKATLSPAKPNRGLVDESRSRPQSLKRSSLENGGISGGSSVADKRRHSGQRQASQSPAPTFRQSRRYSDSETSPYMKASDKSESFVDSITASSGRPLSGDEFYSSGSQVLSRSDIFRPRRDRANSSSEDQEIEQASPKFVRSSKEQTGSRAATPRLPEHVDEESVSVPGTTDPSSLKKLMQPIQKAAGIAGKLHKGSKDMSALLATNAMGYVEKVSGMWAGGRRHYHHDLDGPEDIDAQLPADSHDHREAAARYRAHFGLPDSENLLAAYFGFVHRVLPLYGKIYIGSKYFCFRSLLPGTSTRIILPLQDIETVHKEKGFRLRYSGLVVVIQGYEELFFEFNRRDIRDDCAAFLHRCLDACKLPGEHVRTSTDEEDAIFARAEHHALMEARRDGKNEHELEMPDLADNVVAGKPPTVSFDDPRASILNFKPTESLSITCLTIGSRGDVQPYIALCIGLLAEGHKPKIATHAEFGPWVESYGIAFEPVDGDPAELMRICVENGMFTVSFLREASTKFRGWIDDLLSSAWKACQGSDLLIESPSAMAGIHIAEALGIPYFRAFTMPWTRTRAYPHAFAVPEHRMGGAYNWLTYVMFDNVFWAAISGQVNRWRKKELGLPSTTLEKLHPNKVPFLYNFSPSVVIPPIDYSDWVRVTGYWFLNEGESYDPDRDLTEFIATARSDGKKLVYIGFGSIVVSNPKALTQSIVEAVLKADVRCILSKGWSDRLGKDNSKTEVPLPSEILQIKSCPHDWLFKQVDCAVHHGGAGTTGASLRAGLPTIVKPFFGDQFFFANRIEDLQVGVYLKKLNVTVLSRALWEATHSERMIAKARVLGQQIREEDGVGNAIKAIYRDMEYAKSLIKPRSKLEPGGDTNVDATGDQEFADEEAWTFIGDEADPELVNRIVAWDGYRRHSSLETDTREAEALKRSTKNNSVPDDEGRADIRGLSQQVGKLLTPEGSRDQAVEQSLNVATGEPQRTVSSKPSSVRSGRV